MTPLALEKAKRIVIKIGSALVTDQENGTLKRTWLDSLAEDVYRLHADGKEIVLVASGAVPLGKHCLNIRKRPLKLEEKQAAAACGQIVLMHSYKESFAVHQLQVAQVLLTVEDSESRRRYLNARNTLQTLIEQRVIPIINENDTVATAELRFGDNDRLAARVAQMVDADVLILLSDIDGLYTANPQLDKTAELIPEVRAITPEIEKMAGGAVSGVGTGGMATKIMAAKMANHSGCHMVITAGKPEHPLKKLQQGAACTWFIAGDTPFSARKHWIASSVHPVGKIIVNGCAVDALKAGKSLLPIGVVAVHGQFERGDNVSIQDEQEREIGRGLVAYSFRDAEKIIGKHSQEIEALLGFSGREELIHRDDLVIITKL